MRGRTLAALAALAVVDVAVLALGYRAQTGTLPPLQRSSEAFEVAQSPTSQPTGSPTGDDVVGPVLLGVNAAGDVLRATRGACEERFDNPTRIWAGNVDDGVALAAVEVPPDLREVLGLMVYPDRTLRVSGLDEQCDPLTFDSTDAGATWQVSDDVATVWRMSGDVTAATVTGPRGSTLAVPCAVSQIVNLPARRAVASCRQSNYFTLAAGEQVISLIASDYSQLSVTPAPADDGYFVLGETGECTASFGIAVPEDQSVDELECFQEDKAPLAIASAEGLLLIQLGNDLRVSRDDGETFEPVGEPSEESTAAAS